jgi:hypothetical protein
MSKPLLTVINYSAGRQSTEQRPNHARRPSCCIRAVEEGVMDERKQKMAGS